jgi:hypothetical protein
MVNIRYKGSGGGDDDRSLSYNIQGFNFYSFC